MLTTDGAAVCVVRELIVDTDHRWYSCVWLELIVDADHRWYCCVCGERVDC